MISWVIINGGLAADNYSHSRIDEVFL